MARSKKSRFVKYKWRIYADENVDNSTVQALRKAGMDVLWVTEDPELRKHKDDRRFHARKARELDRYLLTRDKGFWSDVEHPIHQSPAIILLTSKDREMAPLLVRLLKHAIDEYNPLVEALNLEGFKIRLSDEGLTVHGLDKDTQQKVTDSWLWKELF